MPSDGKKGITVKIDADLHAEVWQYLESHEMTMGEFVTLALQDELHPKFNMKEEKYMGKMRTLALQIPEDLFQRIKDYLQRNNMTQKEFIIGLIEDELERDLTKRESVSESVETEESEEAEEAVVSDFETVSEEAEEDTEEQTDADFSDEFEAISEESEGETDDESYSSDEESDDYSEDDEDESEEEHMGFSMGM